MPIFVSAALWDIPRPDFVDVAAAPLPAHADTDPARWAGEVFSLAHAPAVVRALLGLRQVLAPPGRCSKSRLRVLTCGNGPTGQTAPGLLHLPV